MRSLPHVREPDHNRSEDPKDQVDDPVHDVQREHADDQRDDPGEDPCNVPDQGGEVCEIYRTWVNRGHVLTSRGGGPGSALELVWWFY